MAGEYKIKIITVGDTKGVEDVEKSLKHAETAADDFLNSIKAGVGIDLGGKLVNSIAAIPGILQSAVSRGVEFNVTMSNAEVGISNVLAKFMGLDKEAAKAEAAKAMQQLIELEPKAAGGLEDLVGGFLATVAASQSAGVSVAQNIDLVGKFANAVANANLPTNQLAQEMRAILTGNITPDAALAKILEIKSDDIKKAKEAGNLYQFLVDKLGSLGEAGDSAAVRLSTFNSAISKALGKITEPVFDAVIEGVKDLTDSLESADGEALKKLGYQIAELVKSGYSLTQWAIENNGAIVGLGKSVGVLVAAYAAFKIGQLVTGLSNKAKAILSNKVALEAEAAALAKNTAAQTANTASRSGANSKAPAGRASNIAGAASIGVGLGLIGYDYLQSKAAEINARSDRTLEIGNQISSVANSYDAAIRSAASLADKQKIIADLEADIKKVRDMSTDASAEDAELIERSAKLLERKLQTARNLSDEKLKEKEAAAALAAEEKKQAEQLEANKEIIAQDASRRADRARDRIANEKIKSASAAAEKGDIESAKRILDEAEQYYKDYLESTKDKTNPATQTKDQLKDSLQLTSQIESYLQAIKDARAELPKAIEEAEKKSKDAKVKSLEEEIKLVEAEGKERIADIEASASSEAEILKMRSAVEDEIAAKRLALENEIGDIQGESQTARAAREVNASAEFVQRGNELRDALKNLSKEKKGPAAGSHVGGISAGGHNYSDYGLGVTVNPKTGKVYDERGNDVTENPNFRGSLASRLQPRPSLTASTAVPPAGTTTANTPQAQGGGQAAEAASAAQGLSEALKPIGELAKTLQSASAETKTNGAALKAAANLLTSSIKQIRSDIEALKRAST